MLSLPMSPLTPLPETPHPFKFSTMAKGRYTGVGWGTYLEEEAEVCLIDLFGLPISALW